MLTPRFLCIAFALLVFISGVGTAADDFNINHEGDRFILDATSGQHVHGTTLFDEGTMISVRITSTGETHPFLMSKSVPVGTNGTFDVEFDLTELAPLRGGPVTVAVRHNESQVYATNATLVTYNMPENSTLTPAPPETTETTTTTTTESPTPTGVDVPGFSLVTAGVALVTAAALARR